MVCVNCKITPGYLHVVHIRGLMCFSAAYQGLPTDLGGLFHYEPLSQSYMHGAKLVVSSNQWAERGGGVKIHVHELLCERPSSEQGTFPFFPTKMSMFSRKWLVYASGFSFARPQSRYALRWSMSSLRQARRPGRRTVTWAAKAAVAQRATYHLPIFGVIVTIILK